jgi:hypothetical protein
MWFAPASTFDPLSVVGIVLLCAGIILEALGIALEHRIPPRDGTGKRP